MEQKITLLLILVFLLICIIVILSILLYDNSIANLDNAVFGMYDKHVTRIALNTFWDKPEYGELIYVKGEYLSGSLSTRDGDPVYQLIRDISEGRTEKAMEIFELFEKYDLYISFSPTFKP